MNPRLVPQFTAGNPRCLTSYLNFLVVAGTDFVDQGPYFIGSEPDPGPRCGHEHQYRQLPGRQVLLMPEALIGRDEEFVAIPFGSIKQGAVAELCPSTFEGRVHAVLWKVTPKRYRSSLIEQNPHEAPVSARARSS